jgi:holliday junction DNA helicase RuvB
MLEDLQYPQRWTDYIGQQTAKNSLQVAAKSARLRRAPLEHTLIAHPTPGIGKTALAVLTAHEMKRPCRVLSGALNEDQARWFLTDMDDHDLLVYDEFHRLFEGSKKAWAWILHFMQDGAITGPLGMEEMPRVTLIATTTEAALIPPAVASRFMVRPQLTEYTLDEAARIAQRMAGAILEGLPALSRREATELAAGAACNPRAIRQLLTILRDVTVTDTIPRIGTKTPSYDIQSLLRWEGITEDGLDRVAQRYLVILATELGGVAGEKTLADRLQHAGGLAAVERVLMDRGLVAKTKGGRALTSDGMRRARALMEAAS